MLLISGDDFFLSSVIKQLLEELFNLVYEKNNKDVIPENINNIFYLAASNANMWELTGSMGEL